MMRKAPTTVISDRMSSTISITSFMCRLRSIGAPPLFSLRPSVSGGRALFHPPAGHRHHTSAPWEIASAAPWAVSGSAAEVVPHPPLCHHEFRTGGVSFPQDSSCGSPFLFSDLQDEWIVPERTLRSRSGSAPDHRRPPCGGSPRTSPPSAPPAQPPK